VKLLVVLFSLLVINGAAVAPARLPSRMMPAMPPASVNAPPNSSVDPDENAATYGPYGVVWRVHTVHKEIALTFDDGPYPFYTPVLLHVLDRSHVPATFFIVGRSAQEFPELVTRIVQSGDEIGNHTFNHYTLTSLRDDQIAYQIAADGALLSQFTGRPLSLFRPPHGRFNRHVVAIARDLGYHTIFWSAAADDVKDIPPEIITTRVMTEASPGGIILLHSGQYRTIEALPGIIDGLRAQGYSFVTVSKLIEDGEAP
jgi:peptidoglycan-N-acetylglucosamine deacetylase